jgi:uncharacterized membrane protein
MTPNHLSVLGIIHTAISILAIIAAVVALIKYGKIDPKKGGMIYIWLTVITCVTGFPIMKTGHFTPGHFLAIIIIVILPIGIYARKLFGKAGDYIQVIILSLTLFFSMIPATVETLTRLPISAPIAADPNAPIIQGGLAFWFVLYLAGVTYQIIKIKKQKKNAQINPAI